MPRPSALLVAVLWLLGAGISAVAVTRGLQPNDEGLMLAAADRIARGQVPYGDFWWFYPPGQPYLLGGLQELFGPSLLTWRIVRVLTDATVAALAFVLARRGGATTVPALVAWLAAALAMATPTQPHPFPIALAAALGALLLVERHPAWAGVLAGVCAAWRIEFAGYLALGVLLALIVRPGPAAWRAGQAGRFLAAAALAALVLFAPVVGSAGPGESWDLLVRYPLLDFQDYQSLPFPLAYDGPLNTSSVSGFVDDSVEPLLVFYVPLVLVAGLLASLVSVALRARRETEWPKVAVAVFAVGMAHYLLVRPDLFHTAPLAVLVSVLAAWAVSRPMAAGASIHERSGRPVAVRRTAARRRLVAVPAVMAALALAYVVVEGLDRRWLAVRDEAVALDVAHADGVQVPPASARPLERAVRDVQARVPPGRPIYVTTLRNDLVTSGNPLFYLLAQRPNPTRYDIAAPGVVTSAPVQREIVRDLERTGTRVVVRYTAAITAAPEPNRAGRSTGVRVLDDYLRRAYRPAARYGPYTILLRRSAAPARGAGARAPAAG